MIIINVAPASRARRARSRAWRAARAASSTKILSQISEQRGP
jgi:hypothetical protein